MRAQVAVAPRMGTPKSHPVKPTPPKFKPDEKPTDRKLFLMEEFWTELAEGAAFEDSVWKAAGAGSVSRNDFIEFLLKWALPYYWEGKGGRPKGGEDRAQKIRKFAAELRAELDAEEAERKAKTEAERSKK